MKKLDHIFLDLFFILASLEGAAAVGYLLSIPGDPKNSVFMGLSMQRLLLVAAMAVITLAIAGLFVFHRRTLSSEKNSFDAFFSTRKTVIVLHLICSFLFAVGLWTIWGISSVSIYSSPGFFRLAPVLGWAGLAGFQGILFLVWFDSRVKANSSPVGFKWITITLSVVIGGGFIIWFLFSPGNAGIFVRKDLTTVGPLVFLLFFLLFSRKEKIWMWVTLSIALLVYLIPLIGAWASGESDLNFLTGLFPFNDAHGYYLGARRLVDGNFFNSFAARRPLFPAMLGFLLGITSQNLQISILILVILAGISTFLFSVEIRRTHGSLIAGLAFVLSFLFFRRFIGSTMTETQGFAMGAAAFAVMWRSISDRNLVRFAIGLACLSIALNARAGPFFILPALVLWAVWFFRDGSKLRVWMVLAIGVLAAGIGFAGNSLIFNAASDEDSVPFSNFSYTLYGTAVGGKGWIHYQIDHPELTLLNEPELSQRIFSLAFEEIRRNPVGLVEGSIKAWESLLSLEFYGMFGFVQGGTDGFMKVVRLMLFLLSLVGLIAATVRWRNGFFSFVLACIVGIWFSVPFVPPLDAEIRTYATVIPLFAIIACLGLYEGLKLVRAAIGKKPDGISVSPEPAVDMVISSWISPAFALLFSLAAIVGPLIIWTIAKPPVIEPSACPQGEEAVAIRINPGSYLQVVEDQAVKQTWLPTIRWSDFSKGIHDFPFYDITEELDTVSPPKTLTFSYDLVDGRHVWLVADTRIIPQPTGVFSVCGTWSPSKEKNQYGFFYGNSFHLIPQNGHIK
jgi:hypothetical protein